MSLRIEYLVIPAATIDVAGRKYVPFSYEVPAHVKGILGVAVSTSSVYYPGLGSSLANSWSLGNMLKYYRSFITQRGIPAALKFEIDGIARQITLAQLNLGKVVLRSYDAAQQFFSQTVGIERMELRGTNEDGDVLRGSLDLSPIGRARKSRLFTPSGIPVHTRELSGFYETTDFGAAVDPTVNMASDLADLTFLAPYQVFIHLKCLVEHSA